MYPDYTKLEGVEKHKARTSLLRDIKAIGLWKEAHRWRVRRRKQKKAIANKFSPGLIDLIKRLNRNKGKAALKAISTFPDRFRVWNDKAFKGMLAASIVSYNLPAGIVLSKSVQKVMHITLNEYAKVLQAIAAQQMVERKAHGNV